MPTQPAERREREVVELAVEAMRSMARHPNDVRVDGWPDDDRGKWQDGLTVEAVLSVAGGDGRVQWAADVMTVAWNDRLRPAVEPVHAWLLQRLTRLANQHGRGITVSFHPPIGVPDGGETYAAEIVRRTSELLSDPDTNRDPFEGDAYTYVQIHGGPLAPGGKPVMIGHSLTMNPDSRDELLETLAPKVAETGGAVAPCA